MRIRVWQGLSALLPLALMVACGGTGSTSSDARVDLQAQFQKVPLTASGFGNATVLPARYCYAEVCDANSGDVLSSGYLGSDGTGTAYVTPGTQVFLRVYAEYQVPSSDPNSFFMRGSVKNAPMPSGTTDAATFAAIPDWSVTSATVQVDQSGTLSVTAQASNRIAGAFNIADQAITFASAIRDLDGSATLRLPNLHTFWTTSTNPADQTRTYPAVVAGANNTILTSSSGRALFEHQVFGNASGAKNTETDEWDDGVLQETFVHLLFADFTAMPDGSSALSLLRRDNDNVYVDRDARSESTVAFVDGFADFMAGAILGQPQLLDSYVSDTGARVVDDFDLSSHSMVSAANQSEFARGSVAVSLWGIWQNALGGSPTGLQTLWGAIRSTTAYSDGTGEYEQATLGCYPSYLLGVYSRVSATTWNSVLNELSLESIPAPNTLYFQGNSLWQTVAIPSSTDGTLQTYQPPTDLYYGQNQSQAFRFFHGGGPRTITMDPTGGQDFYLELLGPGGWVAGSYSGGAQTRTLSFTNLPAGVYAARVRAGVTSLTGSYGYTLSIN